MKSLSKMKKLLIGVLSLAFIIGGILCVNTISRAEDIKCQHYDDISNFREDTPSAPPADDGYIFAGWYHDYDETTKKFSNPLSKTDTDPENGAYAKFVPDYILSTKAQVSVNVIADDITGENPAAIRLVTSIDSLDYDSVGFVITRADKPEYKHDKSAKTVSKTMYYVGKADGEKMSVTPAEIFGPSATYFRAFTFTNMPESAIDTEITATPYWITLDGTRVEGTQGVKTLNKGRSWIFVNAEANADGEQYGTKEHPYTSISTASADVLDDQEGKVYLQSDIELTSQIEIGDVNVAIQDDGTKHTISRSSEWTDDVAMFKLGSTSQLSFASTGTDESPMLVIDGNKANTTASTSTRLVSIPTDTTVNVGKGVQISNHKTTNLSGAIDVAGGTLNITGGIFDGNEGTRGGVIYVSANNSSITVNGGTFSNNQATSVHGGAMDINGICTTFSVKNAVFESNTASNQGGAVYFENKTMNATIQNCTFISNSATYGGAIVNNIQNVGYSVMLDNNSFTNNTATTGGGVLSTAKKSVTELKNNTFRGNIGSNHSNDVRVGDATSKIKLSGTNSFEAYLASTASLYLNKDFDVSSQITIICAATKNVGDTLVQCTDSAQASDSLSSFVPDGTNLSTYSLATSEEKLVLQAIGNVAQVGETSYTTLQNAITTTAESGTTEFTVKLLKNLTLAETVSIPDNCNVTIQDDGTKRVIQRSSSWSENTAMFVLGSESQLSFVSSSSNDDNIKLIVDGNKNYTAKTSTRLVSIPTSTTVNVGKGVQISNHKTTNLSGAIDVAGGTLNITGGIFDGNEGTRGGVIYVSANNSSITVNGGTFSNNKATSVHGGAMDINGICTTFSVKNAVFESNTASNQGGAIYFENKTMNASIQNCTFISNSATYGGAIINNIQNVSYSVTLDNNSFINNTATTGGGVLSTGKNTVTVLKNNTFNGNAGASQGADVRIGVATSQVKMSGTNNLEAYLWQDAKLYLNEEFNSDSQITMICHASENVGDILVQCANATQASNSLGSFVLGGTNLNGYSLAVSDSNLVLQTGVAKVGDTTYNSLSEAIASAENAENNQIVVEVLTGQILTETVHIPDGYDITIIDDGTKCTLLRSNSWSTDSALFSLGEGSKLSFDSTGTDAEPKLVIDGNKTNTTSNTATRLVSIPADAIVNMDAGVKISNHKTTSTEDTNGGAISVEGGTLHITGGVFDGNEGARGGAINVIAANSTVNITGATFSNNKATMTHGGGIHVMSGLTDCAFVVKDAKFTGNTAAGQGGAIYFNNSSMDATIENCTFTLNTSQYGGAIVNNIQKTTNKVSLNGNTFTGNKGTSGGGVLSTGKNTVTVLNNNTFSDNTGASQGADVRVGDDNSQVILSGINKFEVWLNKTAYLTLATDFETSSSIDVLCNNSRVTATNALVICEDPTKATDSLNSFELLGSNLAEYTLGVTEAGDLILKTKVTYPIASYNYKDSAVFELENWWTNIPTADVIAVTGDKKPFSLPAVDGYAVMQGGCTDGTYAYLLLENKTLTDEDGNALTDANGDQLLKCMLFKVDMATWTVVGQSEPLDVDHGNAITYNSKTNKLVVAHCKSNKKRVSFINPDTLQIEEYKDLEQALYSITYNATKDQYVIGVKGTYDFAIYNSNFERVSTHAGINNGIDGQNIYCDDDYIYTTYTVGTDSPYYPCEVIMCYNWDGTYAGVYRVNSSLENEAMFAVGDKFYMTFYARDRKGGTVYQLFFDKTLLQ